jgi:flavin reductase (DIM6/NTAB) family NADH-FMN oxidoreductase RutF
MHYDATLRNHGLKHDPFKALVAPRPIGWIGTLDAEGRANLAPYSFFNAVSDAPPFVVFSSGGRKHSIANAEARGEFTCSIATWSQRSAMNLSSAPVAADVDEFELAGLGKAPSRFVAPPRVAGAPAALECRWWKTVELPAVPGHEPYYVVFGRVVGVYIDDAFIDARGRVDTAAMQPIARMGYMDYARVSAEHTFALNRPLVADDGRTAAVPQAWDGAYR